MWPRRALEISLGLAFCAQAVLARVPLVRPNWVGSWAAAQQAPEANNSLAPGGLRDATLRQVVRLSIGGEALSVHISNAFGTAPLEFTSVRIARPTLGAAPRIDTSTDRALTFPGGGSWVGFGSLSTAGRF